MLHPVVAADDEPPAGAVGLRWTVAAVVLIDAFLAYFVTVGADCLWLVALGDDIRARGSIPSGVPFAAADTTTWHNVPVLAELTLSLVHELGIPGLAILQVLASATALVVVALDARAEGGSDLRTAGVLALFAVGGLTGLAVVRLQLFSLVAFAILFWFLRSQHRRPTPAIWWLPLIVALWTNLHGAVLLGVAVAGAYLLFSRLRRRTIETVLVGSCTLLALLATPAGVRTASYYAGVLGNEAARQGAGLWARVDLTEPFDIALIAAAAVLTGFAVRRGLPAWEWVVLAGLVLATIGAARNGLWLVMWATPPAAAPARMAKAPLRSGADGWRLAGLSLSVAAAAAVSVLLWRGAAALDPDAADARAIAEDAGDRVVLAPEPLAEALAVDGARLWVLNPIDAFSPADQRAYLAFLDGDPSAALPHADVVVAEEGSTTATRIARAPGFVLLHTEGRWTVFVRE